MYTPSLETLDRTTLTRKNYRAILGKYYTTLDVCLADDWLTMVEMEINGEVLLAGTAPCYYCGAPEEGFDHVPPLFLLYRKLIAGENVSHIHPTCVTSCLSCNSALGKKAFLTPQEGKTYIQSRVHAR